MGLFPKDFATWCSPSRISYMIGFAWLVIGIYFQFRLLKIGGIWGALMLLLYSAFGLFGVWYHGISLDCLCKRGYNGLAWFLVSIQILGALLVVVGMITMGATAAALMASKAVNMSKGIAKESFSQMVR
jgi:hypothetical protein